MCTLSGTDFPLSSSTGMLLLGILEISFTNSRSNGSFANVSRASVFQQKADELRTKPCGVGKPDAV